MKTTHEQYPFTETTTAEIITGQPSWFARAAEQARRAGKAGLVGITSVGALMLSACNNPVQGIPEGQPPAAGSTENPGTPSPSKNIEPTNEANNRDYEPTPLSAELSPQELGKAYFKSLDGCENSLSLQKYADGYFGIPDATEYRKQLVDKAVKNCTDALFIKDWKDHNDLRKYAGDIRDSTNAVFGNYISTTQVEYTDERYRSWREITDVTLVDKDKQQATVQVSGIDYDNSEGFGQPTTTNGTPFTKTLTFKFSNKEARLAGYA